MEIKAIIKELKALQLPSYRKIFQNLSQFSLFCHPRMTGKSHNIVLGVMALALSRKVNVCFSRLTQESLLDSLWREVKEKIDQLSLNSLFKMTQDKMVFLPLGVTFFFKGLSHPQSLKGLKGVSLLHIDEAQQVSQSTMQLVVPSIRSQGKTHIILSANLPKEGKRHWLYKAFYENPLKGYAHYEMNQEDNTAFFQSREKVLEWREKQKVFFRGRESAYRREILGEWREESERQIFKNLYEISLRESPLPQFWVYHYKGGQHLWLGVAYSRERTQVVCEDCSRLPSFLRRGERVYIEKSNREALFWLRKKGILVREKNLPSLAKVAEAYAWRELAVCENCPYVWQEVEQACFREDPQEENPWLYETLTGCSGIVMEALGLILEEI